MGVRKREMARVMNQDDQNNLVTQRFTKISKCTFFHKHFMCVSLQACLLHLLSRGEPTASKSIIVIIIISVFIIIVVIVIIVIPTIVIIIIIVIIIAIIIIIIVVIF